MNTKHRFNRDEISNILKRAAELEHKDNVRDDSDGLTLAELQQVSTEVGLHPKYIQLALDDIKNPAKSITSNFFGGPFSYSISNVAKEVLEDEDWEEIVSEIRRIHGGIGKTSKLGNTFEWEQRKREVGYIQISLSPKKDHTKININANYGYYASVIYMLWGTIALMLSMTFLKISTLPLITQIIIGTTATVGVIGTVRFYLSNWMKRKHRIYRKLILRFQEILGKDNEEAPSTIMVIPEPEVNEEDIKSRNKEKTK